MFAIIIVTFYLSDFCQVVQEYERAVIFRLGRLLTGGSKGPGELGDRTIKTTRWKISRDRTIIFSSNELFPFVCSFVLRSFLAIKYFVCSKGEKGF